jgi:hypothetical protein
MLKDSRVSTRIPARDPDRARAFHAEKLGLEPVEERPGGLLYAAEVLSSLYSVRQVLSNYLVLLYVRLLSRRMPGPRS